MNATLRLTTIATLAAAALAAHAATLSNNLGADLNYFDYRTYTAGNFRTDGSAYGLSSVSVAGFDDASMDAWLYSDDAGLPGQNLGALTPTGTSGTLATFSGGNRLLAADTDYWVVFANPDRNDGSNVSLAEYGTSGSGIGYLGQGAGSDGSGWSQNPAPMMSVQAQPVPEPGSFAALGVGAVSLLRRRFRKNA